MVRRDKGRLRAAREGDTRRRPKENLTVREKYLKNLNRLDEIHITADNGPLGTIELDIINLDGVFGVADNGDNVILVAGDDGDWWVIGNYSRDWIPGIIAALRRV